MRKKSSESLKAVMNERGIKPPTLAEWWGVEADSVNRITGGINLITTDKLYILYDKIAVSPSRILLGEDYIDKLVQQTIEVRNREFHGHYERSIPEIIIDLSRMIPEEYQDEAFRRLVQYFAMKLY